MSRLSAAATARASADGSCWLVWCASQPRSSSAHVVARTLHRRKRLGSEPEMEARLSVTRKFQLSKLLKMAAVVLLSALPAVRARATPQLHRVG